MIQTTITTFGTIGSMAIEIASCIINNTIMLCSEIISLDCSEISTKLNNGTTSKVDNFAQLWILDQYILEMSELNYWRMFSAPVLIVYSVSMSIFCQIAVNNFKKHETNSKLKAN